MRPFRPRWLSLLLPLTVVFLPGCFSYQQPRHAGLQPKADIIVRFASPRTTAFTPRSRADSVRTCHASLVKGKVSAIAGDTITLSPIRLMLFADPFDPNCYDGRAVRFERIPGDRMTVRAFSPKRTGVLVLVVGLLAYVVADGLSNMDFGFPSGCLIDCPISP